ncbi:MAG TPA: acyl-CoA dehydrogenase family protein [Rhodopila sp.]|uniref:acyl-CoA dehydrogenase family protein n=1 Tax=Rhodopila sp. TaxID=2480087 RepID=UPI002C7937DB|nr:acyl-CoA dehydrogenase family protein [Rhodopila sp.]HVY14543.1 acyl-CoA dehydrogenase family protein [Rhodopila sp.]
MEHAISGAEARQMPLDSDPSRDDRDLRARAEAVAAVAAKHADAVDRAARFPDEALAAMREQRLLGIMLPAALGGEGATLSEIVDICYRLGQACSSAAMIYAMHQACVACVLRHAHDSAWHETFLRRIAAEQMLLASSTTEGQAGGNVRSSAAPVERTAAGIQLDRAATVVSYGEQADAIITTARRSAVSAASDQVLVSFLKSDCVLKPTSGWDTLGMRGTCSSGFNLLATGSADQVLPEPYETIHKYSMVPVSHLAWAGVWAGIAAGAVERARAFVRRAARQNNGTLPPGAPHFTTATGSLQSLRGLIATSVRSFEQNADNPRVLASMDFQAKLNLTKVQASELAVGIVLDAMRACGLSGYRNDSDVSVGRHLRDVLSSPIMINNDRIMTNLATTALLTAVPPFLSE